MENRIAEMCHEKVGADGIVTAAVIKEVLAVIGIRLEDSSVADDAGGDAASTGDSGKKENEQNAAWYKAMLKGSKLFRDKHNNILGGVLSGIAKHYKPEEMVGKKVVFVTNLAPRKICGIESQGMILGAEDENGAFSLIVPEKDVQSGTELG